MNTFETILREKYLDFFNNYLTVEKFAEHNHLLVGDAHSLLHMGKVYHEGFVELKHPIAL